MPPGDVRRCLLALADEDKENILKDLFTFRFKGGVDNHSLGNLIITAAEQHYGGMNKGLKYVGKLLELRGKVIPVSLDDAQLHAELSDGTIVKGESKIDIPNAQRAAISQVSLEPKAQINAPAIKAVLEADAIIIGPGDLYTSLIPNLLVEGMPGALAQTKARLIYVCNLMTKQGETDGYTSAKFLSEIEKYAKRRVDHILCGNGNIAPGLLEKYREEKQFPVAFDLAHDQRALLAPFACKPNYIRHESTHLARELIRLL